MRTEEEIQCLLDTYKNFLEQRYMLIDVPMVQAAARILEWILNKEGYVQYRGTQ